MDTHPDERLPYLELARQGARVVRDLPAAELERLSAVAPGQGKVHVELTFGKDDQGRPWVRGAADLTVLATCQRCLERFDRALGVRFELYILRNAALASELAEQADVLVAEEDSVTLAEVVEDELLLSLPERLCTTEPCEYAPALDFPAPDAPESEAAERTDNPFDVLARLKR